MSLFALKKSLDSTFHGHHQSISSSEREKQIVALFFLDWLYEWSMSRQMMVMFEMATTRHSSKPPRWNHFLDAITCKVTVRSTWHHKIEDISYVIWATWSLILPHFKTRFAHSFPLGAMCNLEDEFRAISQPSFGYTFLSLKWFFFSKPFFHSRLTNQPSVHPIHTNERWAKVEQCWEKITKPLTWPDDRFNNQSILIFLQWHSFCAFVFRTLQ